jgi:hypothetical protein
MSMIPPIEPARPSHATRPVRRRTPEEETEGHPAGGFERQEPEEEENDGGEDGLPHVDIRV